MENRTYQAEDNKWYFRVRGNYSIGPYDNKELAEEALTQKLHSWGAAPKPKKAGWRFWNSNTQDHSGSGQK